MKTSNCSSLASLPVPFCADLWPLHSPSSCYRMEITALSALLRTCTVCNEHLNWHGSNPCCIDCGCRFGSQIPFCGFAHATPSHLLQGRCIRKLQTLMAISYHLQANTSRLAASVHSQHSILVKWRRPSGSPRHVCIAIVSVLSGPNHRQSGYIFALTTNCFSMRRVCITSCLSSRTFSCIVCSCTWPEEIMVRNVHDAWGLVSQMLHACHPFAL